MQIEHVTAEETITGTNYRKTENWHEKPKNKTMQKRTKMQAVG